MLLGQQRAGTILSLLPRDTILLILEWCDWGWFEGAGGETVEGLMSDDDEEEEDVAPTMEEVLMLLPERKRASIGACLRVVLAFLLFAKHSTCASFALLDLGKLNVIL